MLDRRRVDAFADTEPDRRIVNRSRDRAAESSPRPGWRQSYEQLMLLAASSNESREQIVGAGGQSAGVSRRRTQ